MKSNRPRKPPDPDSYLARLSEEKRSALTALRTAIRSAAPNAEECISYGVPGFRLNGKLLASYAASAKHCAFYPGSIVRKFANELKNFSASGRGTIRFSPNKPLPVALVRKIVKARIAQRS